ncbi:MAG: hypothetical protein GX434_16235 [Peptococcaceae bacterium]|nr:hypothetical protein [Peptococcaceae bacterium]
MREEESDVDETRTGTGEIFSARTLGVGVIGINIRENTMGTISFGSNFWNKFTRLLNKNITSFKIKTGVIVRGNQPVSEFFRLLFYHEWQGREEGGMVNF